MVFYRKYRPQTINDLDSAAIRERLTSVLQNSVPSLSGRRTHSPSESSVPHAFLFTGPKGLGKTSTARIVAKAVNCIGKKAKDIEPCNMCDQCKSITNGTNVDILEIDAASNRGIDEIRELKDKIRLAPVSSRMKVYIIDEVHMLTTEAFNALLKTLEEPPEHAMFILCTTEPQKVPSTILSRSFHLAFRIATTDELVRSFQRIVTSEKAEVDEESLRMIASLADGGFRDGAKMLEELLMLAKDKKITKEFIEEKYQVASVTYFVSNMVESFATRDTKKGLQIVSKLVEQGADMKHFLQQLVEMLHAMLLTTLDVQKGKSQMPATKLSLDEMKLLFELLTKAYGEMKFAVLPQLPLELAIIAWAETEEKEERVESPEENLTNGEKKVIEESQEVSVVTLRKKVGSMKKIKALYGAPKKVEESPEPVIAATTVKLLHTAGNGEVTKEWLDMFWKNLINEMKNYNHTVAGLLRGCSVKSYGNKQLIIQTSYKFHKERLDDMKTRDALLKVCKLLTGKTLEIAVELKKS